MRSPSALLEVMAAPRDAPGRDLDPALRSALFDWEATTNEAAHIGTIRRYGDAGSP
jgi:hypothetical protein